MSMEICLAYVGVALVSGWACIHTSDQLGPGLGCPVDTMYCVRLVG